MIYRLMVFLLLCGFVLGAEEVTNGLFTTDSDWTKTSGTPSGWSITGGVAVCSGDQTVASELVQTITGLTDGQWYRISYTIVSRSAGELVHLFDGTALGTDDAPATFTTYAQAIGTSADLVFQADAAFIGSIDIASVVAMANGGMSAYVGGSSSDSLHASWSYLAASEAVGSNGESILEDTSVDVDESDGGLCRITSGVDVSDNMAGCFMNVHTNAGSEAIGRYEILHHDQSPSGADTFLIGLDWIDADTTDMQYAIGGAVPIVNATFDLQDVLDDTFSSATAKNVNIYITGSGTLTATIDVDTGGGTIDTRKSITGVNSGYVNDGTRVMLDGNGSVATCLTVFDDYVTIENIYCTNATSYPLMIGGGAYYYHYSVVNCKADSTVDDAVYASRAGGAFVNCDFRTTDSGSAAIINTTSTMALINSYMETGSTTVPCVTMTRGCYAENSIFVGGTYGFNAATYQVVGTYSIKNCSFYNQVTSCLNITGNVAGVTIYNNLFWVADIANDYAVTVADSGTLLFEDYNFTNITGNPLLLNSSEAGWQGINSSKSLWSDTEANLWGDAGNDDFTVVDASMIDGGMPTLGDEGGTPVDGFSTPGAHQLTQTQSGGGGGGVVGVTWN